jgi:dephospho-CoA kinase
LKLAALTGGIGAGKSAVSTRLAEGGAVVIDADAIVHELQAPGMPLLDVLAERFGREIIKPGGALDRAGLAAIAFKDDESLKALNEIVHPAVRAEIARRIEAERDTDHIVVLDTPLLTVVDDHDFAGLIVVDTPIEVAVERLVAQRGMSEDDARSRISKQISREERVGKADFVIDNGGDLAGLDEQLEDLWTWLTDLPDADQPTGRSAAR